MKFASFVLSSMLVRLRLRGGHWISRRRHHEFIKMPVIGLIGSHFKTKDRQKNGVCKEPP